MEITYWNCDLCYAKIDNMSGRFELKYEGAYDGDGNALNGKNSQDICHECITEIHTLCSVLKTKRPAK